MGSFTLLTSMYPAESISDQGYPTVSFALDGVFQIPKCAGGRERYCIPFLLFSGVCFVYLVCLGPFSSEDNQRTGGSADHLAAVSINTCMLRYAMRRPRQPAVFPPKAKKLNNKLVRQSITWVVWLLARDIDTIAAAFSAKDGVPLCSCTGRFIAGKIAPRSHF